MARTKRYRFLRILIRNKYLAELSEVEEETELIYLVELSSLEAWLSLTKWLVLSILTEHVNIYLKKIRHNWLFKENGSWKFINLWTFYEMFLVNMSFISTSEVLVVLVFSFRSSSLTRVRSLGKFKIQFVLGVCSEVEVLNFLSCH